MERKINRDLVENILSLSPMQEGMLYHYIDDSTNGIYCEQLVLSLSGELNVSLVKSSWDIVVQNNEMLRAVFRWVNLENPIQIVLKALEVDFRYVDLSFLSKQEQDTNLMRIKKEDTSEGFDLTERSFRITLCKCSNQSYEMLVSNHHIIFDGWSSAVLLKEFCDAYTHLLNGKQPEVNSKAKYETFLSLLQNNNKNNSKQFWSSYLKGFNNKTVLPLKTINGLNNEYLEIQCKLESHLTLEISEFVKRNQITLSGLLYAAWGLLLQKITSTSDVMFGTTVSGRIPEIRGIEDSVGLYINTLPLRINTEINDTVTTYLKKIDLMLRERESVSHTSLSDIKNFSEINNKDSLFDSVVVVENYPISLETIFNNDLVRITNFQMSESTNFDLTLLITSFDGIKLQLKFSKKYEQNAMNDLIEQFINVLKGIIHSVPFQTIDSIEYVGSEEIKYIQTTFNNYYNTPLLANSYIELFESQVSNTPQATAVSYRGITLTYEALNSRANKLANYLEEIGVEPHDCVALLVNRTHDMLTSILAVLKVGATFLPIDPVYPEQRIQFMLKDSNASIVLSNTSSVPSFDGKVIQLDNDNIFKGEDKHTPKSPVVHEDRMYIIYTSGSTGMPKGVVVRNKSVVNLVVGLSTKINFLPEDRIISLASFSFDLFIAETLVPLAIGMAVVISDYEDQNDFEKLNSLMYEQGVNTLYITPSRLSLFLKANLDHRSLRMCKSILIGGEMLTDQLLSDLQEVTSAQIYNMYGPTETTVWSSFQMFDVFKNITIGRPILNTRFYILNHHLNTQPVGAIGELCIAGEGLAEGYHNNEALTNDKFIFHPRISKERIYRTGDLATWHPDGSVQLIGRVDNQLKVSGYRVELGEIEEHLLKHKKITNAVVRSKISHTGKSTLIAYIVTSYLLDQNELKEYLGSFLPYFMIPSNFMFLNQIPLNSNGKLNIHALPEPIQSVNDSSLDLSMTSTEHALKQIWISLFGKVEIDLYDNFFDLGGHSLTVMRLVSKVYTDFEIKLSMQAVFKYPTIRELASYMGTIKRSGTVEIIPSIPQEYYPVTAAQRRIFVASQLSGGETIYNTPNILILEGNVDVKHLESTVNFLIERHESLRTSFQMVDNNLVQTIHKSIRVEIEPKTAAFEDIEHISNNFIQPFDLSHAPLIRFALYKIAPSKYVFMVDMHHIICDAVSLSIFFKELLEIYDNRTLEPIKTQYKDYSMWLNQKQSISSEDSEKYWMNTLKEPPLLDMTTDFPRPAVYQYKGNRIHGNLSRETTLGILNLASQTRTTPYMILLTAYAILLSHHGNQDETMIGVPSMGRPTSVLEQTMGMFVNTLPVRCKINENASFIQLLNEVKTKLFHAIEHQHYPIDELIEKLNISRDRSRNPIFHVLFNMESIEFEQPAINDLSISQYPYYHSVARFDLVLSAKEKRGIINLTLEYNTALFNVIRMEQFLNGFIRLLQGIIENPQRKCKGIPILSEIEEKKIKTFANPEVKSDKNHYRIDTIFEAQSSQTPDKIAIIKGKERITYKELNVKANLIAESLMKIGLSDGDTIGIMLESSIDLIACVLGVLKLNAVYLPIDPDFPEERINYMLGDSSSKFLITSRQLLKDSIVVRSQILFVEDLKLPLHEHGIPLPNLTSNQDAAYIIYTSGSTGKPKGVVIRHASVVSLVKNNTYLTITPADTLLQLSNYSFDGSIFDIFGSLLNGATLVLLDKHEKMNIYKIGETIVERNISVFFITTALFNVLIDNQLSSLKNVRKILFGGELASVNHVKKALDVVGANRVIHVYGPTENTVFSTYFPVNQLEGGKPSIPIGKPMDDTCAYILGEEGNLKPIGAVGELFLGGEGLAIGYLTDADITRERFTIVPNISSRELYRTGDLAYWGADGQIYFVGRKDSQIKIRGYRVELQEIEAAILRNEAIQSAVVTLYEKEEEKYLCAYIVSHHLSELDVKNYLVNFLPDFMIPSYIRIMNEFPLSSSGKIDKRALPEPQFKAKSANYVQPTSEIERVLVQLWSALLKKEQVGIYDDFFELGGDSIKAIQLSARLREYDLQASIGDIFTYSNIRQLSQHVKTLQQDINQEIVTGLVPLTPIQEMAFAEKKDNIEHLIQSVVLYRQEGFEFKCLQEIFKGIFEHHDSLRMHYSMRDDCITQAIHEVDKYPMDLYQTTVHDQDSIVSLIEWELKKITEQMSLSGKLVMIRLIKTSKGDHLIISIHHLLIDGISWRILLEDIERSYTQVLNKQHISFPHKTNSYQAWANKLKQYSSSKEMLNEGLYWKKILSTPIDKLPRNRKLHGISGILKESKVEFCLPSDITSALISGSKSSLGINAEGLLLTAFLLALRDWSNIKSVLINIEGHGRDSLFEDFDISRTIGWFTKEYPILFSIADKFDLIEYIDYVSNTLKDVPNSGIGYGILKYLTKSEPTLIEFKPEINFNFLGEFDASFKSDIFELSEFNELALNMTKGNNLHKLNVVGLVLKQELHVWIDFSENNFDMKEMNTLIALFQQHILEITEILLLSKTSPNDYVLDLEIDGIKGDELEEILQELEIKNTIE